MSEKKIQSYENDEIEVQYDPNICIHAGECVRGLNTVFNVKQKPWIKVDEGSAADIMATIDKCPSKALTYRRKV